MVIQNAINNLITPQAANRVYGIARRQCINASSGNFLTTINIASSTVSALSSSPIVCTFATGSDVLGIPIDYVGTFASSQTFTNLTASTTHFFYLERNTITGALTCNKTNIVPIYSQTAPASPVTGQHWFKTFADSLTSQQGYTMYEWSGSAWVIRQRVFIAEITTNASAVSSSAEYAINRKYQSAWIAYSGSTLVATNHNLGMTLAEAEATWTGYGRTSASDLTATLITSLWADAGVYYGARPQAGTRLSHNFQIFSGGLYVSTSGALVTVGQVQFAISSNW